MILEQFLVISDSISVITPWLQPLYPLLPTAQSRDAALDSTGVYLIPAVLLLAVYL